MTGLSAPIVNKVKRFIRLLSSDSDGEIVAVARALNRTLKGGKLDIHALADSIGEANGKRFSEADAAEIYRRGVEDGKREAESGPMFRNVNLNDDPSWHDIALECAEHRHLYEREKEFVDGMVRRTARGGEPSQKQGDWLRKIYARVRR